MQSKDALFTPAERRLALMALVAAAVLTLGMIALEGALRPSLGLYDMNTPADARSDVIDARPMT